MQALPILHFSECVSHFHATCGCFDFQFMKAYDSFLENRQFLTANRAVKDCYKKAFIENDKTRHRRAYLQQISG